MPEQPYVSPGNLTPYYERDGITIFNADCLDVMAQLDGVDHVITDPPYSATTHRGARSIKDLDAELVTFDEISEGDLLEAFVAMGALAQRWIVATVDWQHMNALESFNGDDTSLLRFVRFGVWVKPNGAPQFTGDRPATGWEAVAILHSRNTGKMSWNGGGRHAVWNEPKINGQHPTEKPINLIRQFVSDFTDPGDLILDPFMGSGTTLRAAADLGRRAIGIEINEDYCRIAVERLRQGVLL